MYNLAVPLPCGKRRGDIDGLGRTFPGGIWGNLGQVNRLAAIDKLLTKLDFIVSPATAIPAFEVGPEIPGDVILDWGVNAGSFAFPINLSQQPAVSTPCGLTAAGLPIGLQFVGARGADAKVLSAARDFERASR
jgi:amidase/aspartyl-tRNA(Asn)/glutamyl-tRNA(Gln) amidotransferase subunit A